MKKDMTTLEMALEALKDHSKVFRGSAEPNRVICVSFDTVIGHTTAWLFGLQSEGYVWNEKVEPLKGSYEFESEADDDGLFVTSKMNGDMIRQAISGSPTNYEAVACKRFKVTVNVEEIV